MKLKGRPVERINTEIIIENFLFHHFFPKLDMQLKTETITGDVFTFNLCRETQVIVRDAIEPGEGEINIVSSGSINYARDNALSAWPTFMSMFILDSGTEQRYYILEREYSREAFYEFTKLIPEFKSIGEAFLAIEEKTQLNLEIKKNNNHSLASEALKI